MAGGLGCVHFSPGACGRGHGLGLRLRLPLPLSLRGVLLHEAHSVSSHGKLSGMLASLAAVMEKCRLVPVREGLGGQERIRERVSTF